MTDQYSYIPTEPAKISSALAKLFDSDGATKGAAAASQSNLVMIASRQEEFDDIERIIDLISSVHPARIFVIWVKSEVTRIEAAVSARCHLASASNAVCSEVVRIIVPPRQINLVPSILRSSFVTGMHTELFIHTSQVAPELLSLLLPMMDTVLYDLQEFESNIESGFEFLKTNGKLIDLEWLRLWPWRDEIKVLFNMPTVQQFLPDLARIEIESHVRREGGTPVGGLLIGAWILNRLSAVPVAYGSRGFECRLPDGKTLQLAISSVAQSLKPSLSKLQIQFRIAGAAMTGEDAYIDLRREQQSLEAVVQLGQGFRTSRPLDDESQASVVKRYFQYGASLPRYPQVCRTASELEHLRRGFIVP